MKILPVFFTLLTILAAAPLRADDAKSNELKALTEPADKLLEEKKYAQARGRLQIALEKARNFYGFAPASSLDRTWVPSIMESIGRCELGLENYEEASMSFRDAGQEYEAYYKATAAEEGRVAAGGAFSRACWAACLGGPALSASYYGKRAMEFTPDDDYTQLNNAWAEILYGNTEKGLKTLKKLAGKTTAEGSPFLQVIREDLGTLKQAGIDRPGLVSAENLLAAGPAPQVPVDSPAALAAPKAAPAQDIVIDLNDL